MRFLKSFLNFFKNFNHRFIKGSVGTKLSHFIMGIGNICHKQIVKGLLYFAIQAIFIFIMVMCPL